MGNIRVPYPVAYGERKFFLMKRALFITYDSIQEKNNQGKVPENDVTCEGYEILYREAEGDGNRVFH